GFEAATLTGGAGDNSFTVSGWTGIGSFDGAGGGDTLIAVNDTDFTVTDGSLARAGLGTLTLASVESIDLTGGSGANSFTLSGWTGIGAVDGAGASDVVIASNDVDFVIADGSLARSGFGTIIGLSSVELADLAGGAGANSFTVTGWTG